MESRVDEAALPRENRADERRITLPFPPPMQYPSVIAAEGTARDGQRRAEDTKVGPETVGDVGAAVLPESHAPVLEKSKSPEGLVEEAILQSRRHWPAAAAFVFAGLVVSLLGLAVAVHIRQPGPTNVSSHKLAGDPRENMRAASTLGSMAPVEGLDSGSGFELVEPSFGGGRQTAEPGARSVEPNATPVARTEVATQAISPAIPARLHAKSASAKGPSMQAVAVGPKAATGRAPRFATPRRTAGRPPTGYARGSTRQRLAEPQHGIPVDQIYINDRGELVDAQGNSLRLDTVRRDVPMSDANKRREFQRQWTNQDRIGKTMSTAAGSTR